MNTAMETMPRIRAVTAGKSSKTRFVLTVEWSNGSKNSVDLVGLVHSSKHFRAFVGDPDAFREVQPDEFGTGIEWRNGLDYSAETLQALATEQKPLSGRHLRHFERTFGLNTAETASLFDVSIRTVQLMRSSHLLPTQFRIALLRFENDPTVFAAHYRPMPSKPRGRPKGAAQ